MIGSGTKKDPREILVGCVDCGETALVSPVHFLEKKEPKIYCTRCGGLMTPATKLADPNEEIKVNLN